MAFKLLSRKQALNLLRKKNPENIVRHSLKVSEFAVRLARKLASKGFKVDLKLVEIAALLHDLDKFDSLSKGFDYSGNVKRLYMQGYRKLARTILNLQLDYFLEKDFRKHSLEEVIVQYADKRVKHDKIVSLKQRFTYLYKRYGCISPKVMCKLKKAEKIMRKIDSWLQKNI